MKKLGMFITSILASITLAGVGIGINQTLKQTQEEVKYNAVDYSVISGDYGIILDAPSSFPVNDETGFDVYFYRRNSSVQVRSILLNIDTNYPELINPHFEFSDDLPRVNADDYSDDTSFMDDDGYYIASRLIVYTSSTATENQSFSTGYLGKMKFTIPSAQGNISFAVNEDFSEIDTNLGVSTLDTADLSIVVPVSSGGEGGNTTTQGGGGGNTTQGGGNNTTQGGGNNTTQGGGNNTTQGGGGNSSQGGGGPAISSPNISSGTRPEDIISDDFGVYFIAPSSFPIGVETGFDVFFYKKNASDQVISIVLNVDTNYSELTNPHFEFSDDLPRVNDDDYSDDTDFMDDDGYYIASRLTVFTSSTATENQSFTTGYLGKMKFTIPSAQGNISFAVNEDYSYVDTSISNEVPLNVTYASFVSPTVASSNDASIKTLSVNGATLSPTGTAYGTTTTDYSKSSATLAITLNDSNARVESVKVGSNIINKTGSSYSISLGTPGETTNVTIVTVAQDGTTRLTHTVAITRKLSNNNNLSGINMSQLGSTVEPKLYNASNGAAETFKSSTTNYTIRVSESSSKLVFTPSLLTEGDGAIYATMKVNGVTKTSGTAIEINKADFGTPINVEVTAQDGSVKTYTFNIYVMSDDVSATITAEDNSGNAITLTASGDNYSATGIDYVVTSFKVNVVTGNANATVSYNPSQRYTYSTSSSSSQVGTVTVTVTSESGLTKTYVVKVTRNAPDTNVHYVITVTGQNDGIEYQKDSNSTSSNLNYSLPASAGKAIITITGNAPTTTVTGAGTYNIPCTNIKIVATAQSTYSTTTTVNILLAADTDNKINDIKVLTAQNGTEIVGTDGNKVTFSQLTTNYTLKVPYNVTMVYFDVTKNAGTSSVTNGGSQPLSDGNNSFEIYATSQSGVIGTKYTIVVIKEAAIDKNNLASITVGSKVLTTFAGSGTTVKATDAVYVDHDTTTVTVSAALAADSVTATITGGEGVSAPLSIGKNTLSVTVQSQKGTIKTYTFDVYRGDLENGISNIELSCPTDPTYTFAFTFNQATTEYNISVPYPVDSIRIDVTKVGVYSTITGDTTSDNLTPGTKKTFTIYATNEIGTKGTQYKINVTRDAPQAGNSVDSITVNGQQVTGFSNSTTNPVSNTPLYFDHDTTSVNVNYVLSSDSSLATVSGDINTVSLSLGPNILNVVVISQGNKTKTYKFTVYRGERANTVTDISIVGVSDFAFVQSQKKYTLEVKYNVPQVEIHVSTDAQYATRIEGEGTKSLSSVSPNVFKIYVINEIGEKGDEYEITINRESLGSADPLKISNITVIGSDGNSYYTFNETITETSITVPYTVTSVTVIVSVPTGSQNVPEGSGTYALNENGEKIINCYVRTQDGTDRTQTYTIKIKRTAASSDATLSDIKIDGTSIPGFSSSVEEYNVYKNHGTTSVNVVATPTDSNSSATITGGANVTIAAGTTKKEVTITVLAQNGSTKAYKVNIFVGERNNTITNITIDDISADKFTFNQAVTSYTAFSVPYTISSLNVNATYDGTYGQVFIEGNNALRVGVNTIKVYAVNEIGEKGTEYSIRVERKAASTIAKLTSITIDGVAIDGFDQDTNIYTGIQLGHGVPGITIGGTLLDPTSVVASGFGYKSLLSGRNQQDIIVTAEDGTTNKYTLMIYVGEDKNTIENITISNLEVGQFNFVKGTFTYPIITVPYKVNSVEITVTYDGMYGTITGDGLKSLSIGTNIFSVYVTSEATHKGETYTIEINREVADTNVYLRELKVLEKGDDLVQNFDRTNPTYNLVLQDSTMSIFINAIPESSKSTVSGDYGNIDLTSYSGQLSSGNVIILTVSVIAENGDRMDYKIRLSRTRVDFSNDNTINDITIVGSDGVTYLSTDSLQFNPTTLDYLITMPYNVLSFNVIVRSNASTIVGDGTKTFGSVNSLIFKVYAIADDTTKGAEYSFVVVREVAKNNVLLENIKINGDLIDGFNSNVFSYPIKFAYSYKTIDITAKAFEATSRIEIIANDNKINGITTELKVGLNVVTITVVAQSGDIKIYTLNITRQSNEALLKSLDVDGYSLQDKNGQVISFEDRIMDYYVVVPYEIEMVNITAETYDPTIIWKTYDLKKLNVGENDPIRIVVLPEDMSAGFNIYNVYVTRKTKTSDSVNIDSIVIAEAPGFALMFNSDKFKYSIVVASNVTNLSFDIVFDVAEDETAPKYEILGNDHLNFGHNNVVVVATASNNINKVIYAIDVLREPVLLSDANIKEIEEFASEFDNEVNSYFYQVNSSVSSLDISFMVDNDGTDYKFFVGDKKYERGQKIDLEKGKNEIQVKIYSHDEEIKDKVIMLTIYRGSGTQTIGDLSSSLAIGLCIGVSALGILAVVITYIVARTYKKKRG